MRKRSSICWYKRLTAGVSVDSKRDEKAIVGLTPAQRPQMLTIGEFAAFLRSLPSLGDDTDRLAEDLRTIRAEFPTFRSTEATDQKSFERAE